MFSPSAKQEKPTLSASLSLCLAVVGFGWLYQHSSHFAPTHIFGISWLQGGLIVAALAVIWKGVIPQWNRLYRLTASVSFAGVVGIFLAVGTILGTLIKQDVPRAEFLATYGETGYEVIQFFFLDQVFASFWFTSLVALMGVGLVAVTIRRNQFTPDKFGFFCAHVGVVVILVGAWWGRVDGITGHLVLGPGTKSDEMVEKNSGDVAKLPFGVEVEDFQIERYPARYHLDCFRVVKGGQSSHPVASWKITDGRIDQGLLPGTGYSVEVNRFYRHFGRRRKFVATSGKDGFQRIQFIWKVEGKQGLGQVWITPYQRLGRFAVPGKKCLISVSEKALPAGFERYYLDSIPRGHFLRFRFLYQGGKGKTWREQEVSSSRILMVGPFQVNIGQVSPGSRTISVAVSRSGKVPAQGEIGPSGPSPEIAALRKWGLDLAYRFQPSVTAFPRYLFLSLDDGQVVEVANGSIVDRGTWKTDYQIDEVGLSLSALEVDRGRVIAEPYDTGEEGDPPAAEVVLMYRGKEVARSWLTLDKESFIVDPKREVAVQLREKRPVKSYRSMVAIEEGHKIVQKGAIEVNQPLWHRGYALYQSSHLDGKKTVLQVVYDPGLALVWLGFILVALGVPYVFYVQPRLVARKKARLGRKYTG